MAEHAQYRYLVSGAADFKIMTSLVAVDVGGTNARFALAEIDAGRVTRLGDACTLKTSAYDGLASAWQEFARRAGPLPRAASIAIAAPVHADEIKLTNNRWVIRPTGLADTLRVDRLRLVNDFGAVGHAVAQLDDRYFRHLYGPPQPLPACGAISIVGPGTGLGVALLQRYAGGYQVIETEGGHVGFAPCDAVEDALLMHLRTRFGRVSAERVASGQALPLLYDALCALQGEKPRFDDALALWDTALAATDPLAAAALERLFLALGSAAGDIALAHGAAAVVIAGGLGVRIADSLLLSGFHDRFCAKGRYAQRMAALTIKLITHPQPGLFGAAAAFAEQQASTLRA